MTSADAKAKIRAQRGQIFCKKAQAPDADFNALVKQYSQDPGAGETDGDGGDTGDFAQDEALPPMKPFADAVFAAKSGQVVGPIETAFGFHIVRVDEAAHKPALDDDLKIDNSRLHRQAARRAKAGRTDRAGQKNRQNPNQPLKLMLNEPEAYETG